MISLQMARAIANIFIFLDFSTEESIDDDVAVKVMEELAYDLKQLDAKEIQELVDAFRAIADTFPSDQIEFVRALPEAIGLVDDEED